MNDQTILTPEEEACLPKKPPAWRNWLVLTIAAIIFFISTQISIPGLDEKGARALGYVIAVVLLFLFEVFPIAVISILAVITAAPLGLIPEAEAFANFAVGPGFFVFGVLMIAIAFTSTGFGKRTSLYVSGLLGSKPKMVLLSYMLGTGLISSVLADIPTAFIFGALAVELLKKNGCMPGCSNFGKSVMIGIPIAATVGGLGTPAGGALNVMTISMLQNLCGISVSFLQWTLICFPFAAIMLLICWFILCKVFPAEIDNVEGLDDIEEQKKELGPMSVAEKKYLFIFAIMLILWLTSSIHGLSLWLIAVVGAAFLFMPGIDILNWRKMGDQVSCEVPYLIWGTNVVAYILSANGTAAWIADNTLGSLTGSPLVLILVIAVFLGVYGHFIIPGATALLAVMIPIFVMTAPQLGISAMLLVMCVSLAAHVTTLLPFADPVSMATYNHDYWTIADMIKISVIYGTVWIPVSVAYLMIFNAIGLVA